MPYYVSEINAKKVISANQNSRDEKKEWFHLRFVSHCLLLQKLFLENYHLTIPAISTSLSASPEVS